jgi:ribosomal protein L20A (L18A)
MFPCRDKKWQDKRFAEELKGLTELRWMEAVYCDLDGKKHERIRRRSINVILHVRFLESIPLIHHSCYTVSELQRR